MAWNWMESVHKKKEKPIIADNRNRYSGWLAPERATIVNGLKRHFLRSGIGTTAALLDASSRGGYNAEEDGDISDDAQVYMNQANPSGFWDNVAGNGTRGSAAYQASQDLIKLGNDKFFDPTDYEGERIGKARQFANDLLDAGIQFGGNAVASAATGGLGAAAFMAGDIAGNSFLDAVQDGVDTETAANAALLNAAAQAPLEYIGFGGATGKLGRMAKSMGKAGTVGSNIANKLEKNAAGRFVSRAIPEGATEIAQQYMEDPIEASSRRDKVDWDKTRDEALYAGLVGGVIGGATGNIEHYMTNRWNRRTTGGQEQQPQEQQTQGQQTQEQQPSTVDDVLDAVAGQESGGDYNATNPDSGAYGKYQIMPSSYREWAPMAGLDPDSEQTPENQERVARAKIQQLTSRYGVDGAIVAWYAGDTNGQRWAEGKETAIGEDGQEYSWDAPQGEYPSVRKYLDSIKERMPEIGSNFVATLTPQEYLENLRDTGSLNTQQAQDDNAALDELLRTGSEKDIKEEADKRGYQEELKKRQDELEKRQDELSAQQDAKVVDTKTTLNTTRTNTTTKVPRVNSIETPQNTVQAGAATDVQNIAKDKLDNIERIEKASQETVDSTFPVANNITGTIPQQNNPIFPAVHSEQAAPIKSDGIEPVNGIKSNTANTTKNVSQYIPPQAHVGKVPSITGQVPQWNSRIRRALNDTRLLSTARLAYLKHDKDALRALTENKINPKILEALKDYVMGDSQNETTNSTIKTAEDKNANTEPKRIKEEKDKTGNYREEEKVSTKEVFNPGDKVHIKNDSDVYTVEERSKDGRVYTIIGDDGISFPVNAHVIESAESKDRNSTVSKSGQNTKEELADNKDSTQHKVIDGVIGKRTTVETDSHKEFEVTYKLVPVESLITSHDTDFVKSTDYPEKLQPRERDRLSMKEQVDGMARNLRPQALGADRSINKGAPLVNDKNIVENGNGRVIALKTMYERDGESYKDSVSRYKQYLLDNASEFGFAEDDIESMENPVLVRERSADTDSLQEDIIHSTEGGQRLSASEQAKIDGEKISSRTLSKYMYNDSGDLTSAANRDFVVSILNEIATETERNQVFDKDGVPSQAGIIRVRNALFARAYKDAPLLARFSESTEEEAKNIISAITTVSPLMAQLNENLNQQLDVNDLNLSDTIMEAIRFYMACKEDGKSVDFALREKSLFNSSDVSPELAKHIKELSKEGKTLALTFSDYARKRRQLTDILKTMIGYHLSELHDRGEGVGLFGESIKQSTGELIKNSVEQGAQYNEIQRTIKRETGANQGTLEKSTKRVAATVEQDDGRSEDGRVLGGHVTGSIGSGIHHGAGVRTAKKDSGNKEYLGSNERGIGAAGEGKSEVKEAIKEEPKQNTEKAGTDNQFTEYLDTFPLRIRFARKNALEAEVPDTKTGEGITARTLSEIYAKKSDTKYTKDGRKFLIDGKRVIYPVYHYSKYLHDKLFNKEGADDNAGRVQGLSQPVEMGRPGGSTGDREEGRKTTGTDRAGADRDSGRQDGRNGSIHAETGDGRAETRGTRRTEATRKGNYTRNETGRAEQPIISENADKIEADITNGKVKNAHDVPGHDYIVKETKERTPKARINANIVAVKLLKKIESENRKATPAEQDILSQYSGWGGLTNAFDESKSEYSVELKDVLSEDEYKSARAETVDAYYTPHYVIKAMWDLVKKLGFKGGRILDPSTGTANFFGLMPLDIRANSKLDGIELSSIPARLSAQLYQSARFQNMGFQKMDGGNGAYDLAISNVPFGSTTITDKSMRNKYRIHNYFFAKALDKVRPGGLIAFVTSNSTMDSIGGSDSVKLRRYLGTRAEFVGAVRLPSNLFKGTGAAVTTDIIVLRKLNEGEVRTETKWNGVFDLFNKSQDYVAINSYFVDNPEMCIGTPTAVTGRYGNTTLEVNVKDEAEAVKLLNKAVNKFPNDIYKEREIRATNAKSTIKEFVQAKAGDNVGDIVLTDNGEYGHVIQQDDGSLIVKEYPKTKQAAAKQFMDIVDKLDNVFIAQADANLTEADVETKRKELNNAYDAFVKENGALNKDANIRLFADYTGIGRVLALENYKKKTLFHKERVEKADILTRRTAYPANKVMHITTVSDALVASLQDKGHVDIDYMSELLGQDKETIVKDMNGILMKDPITEQYVTRDEYLSGNVRQKLEDAQAMVGFDKSYQKNIDALKAVIPKDLTESEVNIGLGASIVPVEDVQAFVDSIVPVPEALEVSYNRIIDKWTVKPGTYYYRYKGNDLFRTSSYGTKNLEFEKILEKKLNGQSIDSAAFHISKDDDAIQAQEKQKEMEKAAAIADKLQDDFPKWLYSDKERKEKILKAYNFKYNAIIPREYDGSFLTFPWYSAAAKPLRKHQRSAVWRVLNERSTLLAHCVGSGKTWTMQSAGMELKRLGLAHKIVYTVPTNVVRQFEKEFYEICPNAKILVLDSASLPAAPVSLTHRYEQVFNINAKGKKIPALDENGHNVYKAIKLTKEEQDRARIAAAKRNATLQKIKTNDWDAIILSHETFERIPVSDEYLQNFYNKQIQQYREALEVEKENKEDKRSVRDIEQKIKSYEEKLIDITERKQKYGLGDDTFEELGIDQIFVDEADKFKNLQFATKLQNVKGISTSYSSRAEDMFLKARYLAENPNTHGVVFATGTPISNSVTELYTMCRFLANEELEQLGISSFDQFAKLYISIGDGTVPKQDGSGMELKTMVRGIQNAPECIRLFRKFTDVKTIEDLPEVQKLRPDVEYIATEVAESSWMNLFRTSTIKERVEKIKAREVKPTEDNMLKVAHDFKDATIYPRLFDTNVSEDEAAGKIKAVAKNIIKEYKASKNETDANRAQVVFCDSGTPGAASKARGGIDVYTALKAELIKRGIPENEIRFVQEASNDKKRQELFEQVNEGRVRVLIGSTEMMGAGTNMQKKLIAMHHIDCPWRPRDIEQREGRILRQGNENKKVHIYNYVTKGSYDTNLWNLVKNKAFMINQIMHGDMNTRAIDMMEDDLSGNFEKLEKLANSDPNQVRLIEVDAQIRRIGALKQAWDSDRRRIRTILDTKPAEIQAGTTELAEMESDLATRDKTSTDFRIIILNKTFTKQNDELTEAFTAAVKDVDRYYRKTMGKGGYNEQRISKQKIGSVRGLDIFIVPSTDYALIPTPENMHVFVGGKKMYMAQTNTAIGAWNTANRGIETAISDTKNKLDRLNDELSEAKKHEADTFDKQDELDTLIKEKAELEELIKSGAENESDTGEEVGTHYLITNADINENTMVDVVDVTDNKRTNPLKSAHVKELLSSLVGNTFTFTGGIGTLTNRSGKHLVHSHDIAPAIVANTIRAKALTGLRDILQKCIYVDKHPDFVHGTKTHYIELYVPVRSGNDLYRFHLTAKEVGNTSSEFTVQKALFYNLKKEGLLPMAAIGKTQTAYKSANSPSSKVSIAQLLENARDRDNKPYVIDGKLQFEPGVKVVIPVKTKVTAPVKQVNTSSLINTENEPVYHYSVNELKAQVLDIFKNVKDVKETDNGLAFTLPNGYKVEANVTDENIAVDWNSAQRDYKGMLKGTETAQGNIQVFTRKAIMTLFVDSVEQTPTHEAMHLAYDLFMNDRERKALDSIFKGNVEAMAESMRKWKIARSQQRGSMFGRIWQKVSDLAHKFESIFVENEHNIFRKIAEGRMWERKTDNEAAARVHYSLAPFTALEEFAKNSAHKAGNTYLKALKPEYAKAKADSNITVEHRRDNTNTWGIGERILTNIFSPSRAKDATVKVMFRFADDAQRTVAQLHAKWTKKNQKALKELKSKEDIQSFDSLMLMEDSEKKVFTKEEMLEMGIKPNVIKAHNIVRDILTDTLKEVNDVYTKLHVETKTLKTKADVEAIKKRPYTEMLSVEEVDTIDGKGYIVSYRTRAYQKHDVRDIKQSDLDDMKKDESIHILSEEKVTSKTGGETYNVTYLTYAQPVRKLEGYIPHMFHDWIIIGTEPTGKTFVAGSATSMEKAVKKAHEMHTDGVTYKITPKSYSFEDNSSPVILGHKDYEQLRSKIAEGLSMTLDQADELLDAKKESRHVFYSAILHRTGAEGYETNVRWVLQQHITQSARYCGLETFAHKATNLFERSCGSMDKKYPVYSKENFLLGFMDSVLGKPTALEEVTNDLLHQLPMFRDMRRPGKYISGTVTGFVGLLKLGASPASALVNLTQLANCIGYLGTTATFAGVRHAVKPTLNDIKVLKRLGTDEEVGLEGIDDYGKARLEYTPAGKIADTYNKLSEVLMKPFIVAERTLRRATVLAAYNKALSEGKTEKQAAAYASEINKKVNFDYSVADAPRIFRAVQGTIIGDMTLQFQKYGLKEMEVVSDFLSSKTTARQKARFFLPYFLLGGLFNALPLQDLIFSLIGMFTDDEDPESTMKKVAMEWAGTDETKNALVNISMYGVLALAGIDISQRVGLKGIVPDDRFAIGGATASTVKGLTRAIINGDMGNALSSTMPEAGNLYKAYRGYGTDSRGRKTIDYDGYDRAMKALGFRTLDEAIATDVQSIAVNYKKNKSAKIGNAKAAYINDQSQENYERLKELGYTDRQIKALKPDTSDKRSRTTKSLSKRDKEDLRFVLNYGRD